MYKVIQFIKILFTYVIMYLMEFADNLILILSYIQKFLFKLTRLKINV